jgi:hypothetical protein
VRDRLTAFRRASTGAATGLANLVVFQHFEMRRPPAASDGDGFADAPFGPPHFRVAANAEDATSYVTGLLDLECWVLVDAVAVIRASDVSGWFTRRDEAFLAAVRAVAGGRSTRRSVTTDAATTPSIGSTGCSSPGRTRVWRTLVEDASPEWWGGATKTPRCCFVGDG